MDFEDGERRPWLVAAVGGRRGGLRWGSVYRLKMAVWALFCGPEAARPPPAAGPRPGGGGPGGARAPRAPRPPRRLSPGTWEFRAGLGGDGRAQSAAASGPSPAPLRGNCPDASNFPVSGERGRPPRPRLAFAHRAAAR